ncbi:hypothetical protein NE237_013140 [Protea cynaroides]|uniref:Uncharacterized protein n=1 Tax=Protea cynaroides TaxID=273540 RepID=A0A9Q0JYN6_9MAGN|nr:hypothetical protein NE237_013140 [Protea cynaroides]
MSMEALAMAGADYLECNIDLHRWECRQKLDPPPPHLIAHAGRSKNLQASHRKSGNRRLEVRSSCDYQLPRISLKNTPSVSNDDGGKNEITSTILKNTCKKADADCIESNSTCDKSPSPPSCSEEFYQEEVEKPETHCWKQGWIKIFCCVPFQCFSI